MNSFFTLESNLIKELLEANDLKSAMTNVLEVACRLDGIDCGGVYLVNEEDGSLDLVAHKGLSEEFLEVAKHYAADSPNAALVNRKEPVYGSYKVIKVQNDPRISNEGLKASAIIPILHNGLAIASLNLSSHTAQEIPQMAKYSLDVIAAGIGGAITRIKAEQGLKKSRANLLSLTDSIDDMIFILDGLGNIIETNIAVKKHLGYEPDELKGKTVLTIHPPDLRDEAGKVVGLMLQGKTDFCHIPLVRKDGNLLYVETRVTSGLWNGHQALFGISRDISERTKAEKALIESEEMFHMLAEHSPNMIFINTMGRVIYANRECEIITGYTKEEFYAETFSFLDITAPEYRETVTGMFNKHLQGEEVNQYEYAILTKDHRKIYTIITSKLIIYKEQTSILGIITDITSRKITELKILEQTEELKELNATKDKFFSIIAHDLRSPFNALLGLSKIISDPEESLSLEETRRIAGRIFYQLNNQFNLLQNLLTWSRLQLGKVTLNPVSVNLFNLINIALDLFTGDIAKKDLQIELVVDEHMHVLADQDMLNSIFLNLISNAIKFTHKSGRIIIEARNNNGFTEITVADSGIGIKEENLAHLLKLDKMYSGQGTEGEKGTGLGLLLCKDMIAKHNGTIQIQSKFNEGTTVTIKLPL